MATGYPSSPLHDEAIVVPIADATRATSGVSWGAILAGAVGAASLSLILLLLGTGLGFSSMSPWASRGADAAAIGVAAILWLTFTQIAASGMGGYLAGRLRTRWTDIQGDEVYFRDTAHGFLAWSVATLLTATLLSSAVGAIIGSGVQAGASIVGGVASTASTAGASMAGGAAGANATGGATDGVTSYFVDSLFRKDPAAPAAPAAPATPVTDGSVAPVPAAPAARSEVDAQASGAEVSRIFLNSLRTGALPPEDAKYVGQRVAQRTGLSQADAERRVNETFAKAKSTLEDAKTQAKEAADKARKASAYAALWLVVSLLVGAFVSSLAATYGGRRRDL